MTSLHIVYTNAYVSHWQDALKSRVILCLLCTKKYVKYVLLCSYWMLGTMTR